MVENINKPRSIDIILDELFVGKKSAFEAMSRVRHAQYEVNLWRHGIRSRKSAREYFEKRYLGGIKLKDATEEQLTDALKSLRYAVGKDLGKPTGCYERCLKLVNELNRAIIAERLGSTVAVDGFIDYFTFYPCEPVFKKSERNYASIKTYKSFKDADNRKEFRASIEYARTLNRKIGPRQILKLLKIARELSKKV